MTTEERIRQQIAEVLTLGADVKAKRCIECRHGLEYHWRKDLLPDASRYCAVTGCTCREGI